jgi:hypothetical protein
VKKFAKIEPSRIMLKGTVSENLSAEVHVVPEPDFPFEIVKTDTVDLLDSVAVDVGKDGDGFLVTVKNRRKEPGVYVGKIVLKTDSDVRPEIEIPLLMGLKP